MGADIHGFLEVKKKSEWKCKGEIPRNRCYDMFGILADVRNFVNAIPISKPKGTPKNVTKETEEGLEQWFMDGHSYSWLNWNEIEKYNWEQIFHDGRISTIERETGREIDKASYSYAAECNKSPDKFEYKYLDRVAKDIVKKCGWKDFFDKMKKLADKHGSKNVRIVFWFDN